MAEKEKAKDRLNQARSVLQLAENRYGINSYQQNLEFRRELASGIYEVSDKTTRVVQALSLLLADEFWTAVVGIENLGWEALYELGFNLQRVVKVVCAPEKAPQSLSILLEGFEILVIGNLDLAFSDQRKLAAKARKLDRIIFTTNKWPFISVHLENEKRRTNQVVIPGKVG